MIEIRVNTVSNRLKYVLDWLFGKVYKIPYQIVIEGDEFIASEFFIINYSENLVTPAFSILPSGLLAGKEILPTIHYQNDIPYLFHQSTTKQAFSYDIFSAIFFLLTEYEKYQFPQFDHHERYQEKAYLSYELATYHAPILQVYAQELQQCFPIEVQQKIEQNKTFDYQITFDIDNPWKHRHKAWYIQLGGIAKDLLRFNIPSIKEKLTAIFLQQDVNDVFDTIFELCNPDKTYFFFMIYRGSPHDTRHTYQNQAFCQLIQQVKNNGYHIGIHPSYTSFLSENQIEFEINCLTKIVNQPILHSRQHYLKYRHPQTFQSLIQNGIENEYSYCLQNGIGFPCGTAIPFYWYDLSTETQTHLLIHPTLVMDRSMQHYLKYTPEKAAEKVKILYENTQKYGGIFTILIHNDALSESDEWKNWSKKVKEILIFIQK